MTINRVAIVSPYALSVFGGVQEQVLSMSRELARRNMDVLVVAPDNSDVTEYDTPAEVRTFGSLASMPANGSRAPLTLSPAASKRARSAIDDFSPQLIHFHEPFAPLIGYGALRAHSWPSVGTFHRAGTGPAYSLTRPLLRRLARGLDRIVAVSPSAAATIGEGAGLKADVLFNGFETTRFREFARVPGSEPTIVFIGRLEPRKGVATLVSAVKLARERDDVRWRVVIAGSGPFREEIEQSIGPDDGIEMLGAVSDATKRHLLRDADVVVAPSLHGESFGLVVLEAMAAETRVVVADIDGYRQAAGGHGVLFEAGNPDSLANAISTSLGTNDQGRIDDAREHAEEWSMSKLIDMYLPIYDDARNRFATAR